MTKVILLFLLIFSLSNISFATKKKADLLVYHCTIYTVDASFSTAEAMVIKDGKILAVGKKAVLEKSYEFKERLDAKGKFMTGQ